MMVTAYEDMTPEEQAASREKMDWQKEYNARYAEAQAEREREQQEKIEAAARVAFARTLPAQKTAEQLEAEAAQKRKQMELWAREAQSFALSQARR